MPDFTFLSKVYPLSENTLFTAGRGILLLMVGICIYALISYAVAYVLIKAYAPLNENGENTDLDDIP